MTAFQAVRTGSSPVTRSMAYFKKIDGKPVEPGWYNLLTAARIDGVHFVVNSGHRTLAEQWRLFRQNMQFVGGHWIPKPGHALTAFPSPTAPHIKRHLHAVDFGPDHKAREDVIAYAREHGVPLTRTVRGEDWHLEPLQGFGHFKPSKRFRLTGELRRLRLATRKTGRWSEKARRRADSIKRWLRGHKAK